MTRTTTGTFHPLDPLGADEFAKAAAVLAREHGVGDGWRFASIELAEPDKAAVSAFDASGTVPDRRAIVVCFDRGSGDTYKALVSLTGDNVVSWQHIPDVQANFTVDEWEEADAFLRGHPDVIAALAKRGVTDTSLVFMDVWTYGDVVTPEKYKGRRLGWSDTWVRASEGTNPYAGPVNGFHCVIDVNKMELLEIEDTFSVERPEVMGEYVPRHIPERIRNASTRPPLKPLDIVQPEGPSFTLEGNKLEWQNWSLRVGFNYREGMTLHAVTYNDNGRVRSIANRMSFAEMAVPYRDTSTDHYRRTAFDIGEWGIGFMTTSLTLGCDCLGEIRYLDAVLHDSHGVPFTIENAICIHEEDNAVLWKHVDHDGSEVRRMRRLTVSTHVTVANYEYLVYWRFYQDGNIECEVRATGIMVVSHFPEGGEHPSGTLVDTRTYAPFHQHFLVARLDLDIDGTENTVYATETEIVPMGPDNPLGLALRQKNTPLRTEHEQAGLRLAEPARVESRQRQHDHRTRHRPRLQTRSRRRDPVDVRPGVTDLPAHRRDRPHRLGDAQLPRRTLARRRIREPEQGRSRTSRLDRGRPPDREHRRGALVHVRDPPHSAAGGLADHACGHRVLLAEAGRILRPQPRPRRRPHPGGVRSPPSPPRGLR